LSSGNTGSTQQIRKPICERIQLAPGHRYAGHNAERLRAERAIEALLPFFPGASVWRNGDGEAHGIQLAEPEERFYVAYRSENHRLSFSGAWPLGRVAWDANRGYGPRELWNPNAEDPSITVDASKNAEQVKRDIENRFLPHYRDVLARLLQKRAETEEHILGKLCFAAELAATVGKPAPSAEREDQKVDLPDPMHGEIEVSRDEATFKIRSLPKAQARKLASFLVELAKEIEL